MSKRPTTRQDQFVETIANLANIWLSNWGAASGKTTAREMLAERILKDDTKASPYPPNDDPI